MKYYFIIINLLFTSLAHGVSCNAFLTRNQHTLKPAKDPLSLLETTIRTPIDFSLKTVDKYNATNFDQIIYQPYYLSLKRKVGEIDALEFNFPTLSRKQFDWLTSQYGGPPHEFKPGAAYTLSDFLPLVARNFINHEIKNSDCSTNCWGTTIEYLRDQPDGVSLFQRVQDVSNFYLDSSYFSHNFSIFLPKVNHSEKNTPKLIEDLSGGSPEGIYAIWSMNRSGEKSLVHTFVMIDSNLVFEMNAARGVYRIIHLAAVIDGYSASIPSKAIVKLMGFKWVPKLMNPYILTKLEQEKEIPPPDKLFPPEPPTHFYWLPYEK